MIAYNLKTIDKPKIRDRSVYSLPTRNQSYRNASDGIVRAICLQTIWEDEVAAYQTRWFKPLNQSIGNWNMARGAPHRHHK